MGIAAVVVIGIVAALHVGFFVLESVLWAKPVGRKVFGLSAADAETTRVLASNQGVYNGVLALGLLWSVAVGDAGAAGVLLASIAVVGIYGAVTVKPTIFVLQALPALVALALLRLFPG